MRAAHKNKPVTAFREPPGVVHKRVDPESGLLPWDGQENAIDEVFLTGTEPIEIATPDAGTDGGDPMDGGAAEVPGQPAAEDAGAPQPNADVGDAGLLPGPGQAIPVKSTAPPVLPPPF